MFFHNNVMTVGRVFRREENYKTGVSDKQYLFLTVTWGACEKNYRLRGVYVPACT